MITSTARFKSEVLKFPRMLRAKTGGCVVLATDFQGGTFQGTVILGELFPIGKFSRSWDLSEFVDAGSFEVVLKQE